MARNGRLALVVLVSLAIASTGLCVSLSGGASYCPVAPAAEAAASSHDSCCAGDAENENGTCPASKERPTCRMCDDTVAFLLKGKTDGAKLSPARVAVVMAVVTRPAAPIRARADSLHLSQLSSSPPLHLLNMTFRN